MKRYGDEVVVACPYCGDKSGWHHKHLYINLRHKVFHCKLCDAAGSVERLKRDFPAVVRAVQFEEIAAYIERTVKPIERSRPSILASAVSLLSSSSVHREERAKAVAYLEFRGLSRNDISVSNAVWSPHWSNRVIFPCYENQRVVYYVGRRLEGVGPKWRNPSKREEGLLPKTEVVYGIDRFRGKSGAVVAICEGVFDAIALGGVALLGKRATNAQLRKILNLVPSKVIVALDRDASEEALRIYDLLRWVVKTEIQTPPPECKDWGDALRLPKEEREEAVRKLKVGSTS